MAEGERQVTVVHVDEDESFLSLASTSLEREGVRVVTETSAPAALDRLDRTDVDCVVSDYDVPGLEGLAFLEAVRERHPELPFVLLTGEGSEELASEALAAGVTDYLPKRSGTEQFALLADRVRRAVDRYRTERDRRARLRQQAAVADLGTEALRTTSLDAVVDAAVNRTREALDVPYVTLYRYRENEGLVPRAATGREPADVDPLPYPFERDARTAAAFQSESTVVESRAEDRFGAAGRLSDSESLAGMSAPVRCAGRRWGVLDVDTPADRSFSQYDATFLTNVANVLAGVIERAADRQSIAANQEALERRSTLLERTLETVPVGVLLVDADREITFTNEHAESILDVAPDALVGCSVTDSAEWTVSNADGTSLDDPMEPFERVLTDGEPAYGVRLLVDQTDEASGPGWKGLGDGTSVLSVSGAPWVQDGEVVRAVFVLSDVTEQVRREHELERYRTLVEAVGDPMYMLDREGTVVMANDAMAEALGRSEDALVGADVSAFLRPEDVERGEELIRELREDDDRTWASYEVNPRTAADESMRFEDKLALVTDEEGRHVGTVGVVRDVTERERQAEALERQNERLAEFASVISHDLRNPLEVVQGRLGLARRSGEDRHFDAMETAVERMETLLSELLTLAREGKVANDPEPVPVTDVVRDAWGHVDGPEATVRVVGEVQVKADPTRLGELFENLFRNAVDHAGPDTEIVVGPLDGSAGFFVADDGPGIPPAERDTVFDHGYTTQPMGTGFGLSIVRRIADAHDWEITVTEGDRGGARFEFLPT